MDAVEQDLLERLGPRLADLTSYDDFYGHEWPIPTDYTLQVAESDARALVNARAQAGMPRWWLSSWVLVMFGWLVLAAFVLLVVGVIRAL